MDGGSLVDRGRELRTVVNDSLPVLLKSFAHPVPDDMEKCWICRQIIHHESLKRRRAQMNWASLLIRYVSFLGTVQPDPVCLVSILLEVQLSAWLCPMREWKKICRHSIERMDDI